MSAYDKLRLEVEDGLATITLDRPDQLNALDHDLMVQLKDVVFRAAFDADVRAVLVTGAGSAFCAGGDVNGMMASASGTEGASPTAMASRGVAELHAGLSMLYRMEKPTVAAVNGACAGAGVGLALACDVTWAAVSAKFALAFTGIGLSPDSGTTYHLARAVGPRRATELLLTSQRLTADEALAAGLVTRVLADEELLGEARALAQRLAAGPTRAYAEVKRLMASTYDGGLESQLERERQGITRTVNSADFAEGVMAFVQKREPKFEGR